MKSYEEYRAVVEAALAPALRSLGPMPAELEKAMLYSLTAGGKRLRPVLLLASCEAAGGDAAEALPFACALEMIHTYSLIHDDLPALDNDELRRGKPTSHVVFGEAGAILAGDGLLNSAAELMAKTAAEMKDFRGIRAAAAIMRHAGVSGMIGGQSADIAAEKGTPGEAELCYIHAHKTADLIQAAVEAGLILGGAGAEALEAGRRFGYHFGMAFQMTDDLLDVIGTPETLGKSIGKDAAEHKLTWVSLFGAGQTRRDAAEQIRLALEALRGLPGETALYRRLTERLLDRTV